MDLITPPTIKETTMHALRFFLPALALAASCTAHAVDIPQPLGMDAGTATASREIEVTAPRKYINVQRGEVVRFVTPQGSFTWSFDTSPTVSVFDFARIAPAGIDAGSITVYVADTADKA